MTVGRLCACGTIVMPGEDHGCAVLSARATADNRRRHRKQRDHGRDRRGWRDGVRVEILERDSWQCQLQLDDLCAGDATTVHIRADLDGAHQDVTVDDGVAACLHCHGVADAPRAAAAQPHGGVGRYSRSSARPARVLARAAVTSRGNA